MENLTDLFKIIELTRSQTQQGYILAGIKRGEISNLAEHHYLVTFIAWQLALHANAKGAKIDVQKVLEFSLIHDLGELFGGDIAMPYAGVNPKARGFAKQFEAENQRFLSKFFGDQQSYYQKLSDEIMDAKSDESIIAKLADFVEVTHYKQYVGVFSEADVKLVEPKLMTKLEKIKDPVVKQVLSAFIKQWFKGIFTASLDKILYQDKE